MDRNHNRVTCVFALVVVTGCGQPRARLGHGDTDDVDRRAMECLKAAIGYKHNPVVRVEAVEALASTGKPACGGTPDVLPWIRSALLDDHPAVRFAACLAVGENRDAVAEAAVQKCLRDENASVRVAALFARHRLGHPQQTGKIPGYLLDHEDATVRRNAALVLGLLGEPGAVKVLARAMKDPDPGVRHHALEAMARLGNREARQELTFMTSSGVGSDEVFAIQALAATGDRAYSDTFRYKLTTATHLETRLAAARGLGRLGSAEGLEVALRSLDVDLVRESNLARDDPQDSAGGQILRARQLAASALGAIGSPKALPPLAKLVLDAGDPRVQVSAARAILEINGCENPFSHQRLPDLPFAAVKELRKR